MSNNNFIPIQPMVPDHDSSLEPGIVERDDSVALDPDVNDDLLNSADADRIASETADADE